MTVILQPRELTPEELEAASLEPFLPDDPDGLKWQEEFAALAKKEAIDKRARELLDYWDVTTRAKELDRERSGRADSWTHLDLNEAFDTPQQLPEVGAFNVSEKSNGGGVFYRSKVNEIHGPSESGKTMLALLVIAQEIAKGNNCIMIDFEDDARAVVNRLRHVFGLTRQQITEHLFYYQPELAFNDDAFERMEKHENVSVCLIDAVTEAMSAAGLDGRNENEVATWMGTFPKRLARLGMAVVLVDHTPATEGGRAIGSQHKKSAVTGVSYTVESVNKFAKGRAGQLRIKVAKDKIGGIRPDALPQKDGQEWRGDLYIDGTQDPSHPRVALVGVDPALLHGGDDDSHLDRGVMPGGPTENEKRAVIVALENGPAQGMSTNALCTYIGGRKDAVRTTLEWMRNTGEVLWVKEGNSIIHGLPPAPREDVQEVLESPE